MPTYLMLSSLTEKGTQTLNSNPARLREVNRDVEELGAKVLHQSDAELVLLPAIAGVSPA